MPEILHTLRAIRYEGHWHNLVPVPACLIEFIALTGARLSEVRLAQWKEFDREQMIWTVPPEHKKK
jgi:integrase